MVAVTGMWHRSILMHQFTGRRTSSLRTESALESDRGIMVATAGTMAADTAAIVVDTVVITAVIMAAVMVGTITTIIAKSMNNYWFRLEMLGRLNLPSIPDAPCTVLWRLNSMYTTPDQIVGAFPIRTDLV